MDLPVWFVIATVLIAAAQSDESDKGSQTLEESKPQQKKHKRQPLDTPSPPPDQLTPPSQNQEPPYQINGPRYVMKEMILYLTPSQIKALQTGQGTLKVQPQSRPQPQLPHLLQNSMQQQNTLQQEGELLQREIDKMEANRKNRLRLQEAVASAPTENINHDQYLQQQQQQEQQEQQQQQQQHQQQQEQQQQKQQQQQYQQQQSLSNTNSHYQPEFLNQEQHLRLVSELQQFPQQSHQELLPIQENQHHQPLFYILPQIKPVANENLQLYPADQNDAQQQLLFFPKNYPLQHFNDPNFKLIPYEYGTENELEAKKILIANLENQLLTYRLGAHQLDAQQLGASDQQLEAQRLEAVTQLTAQQYHQLTSEQLDDKLDLAAQDHANELKAQLEAQRVDIAHEVENQQFDSHHLQGVQHFDQVHNLEDAHQTFADLQETQNLQQAHVQVAEKLPEALSLIAGFGNHVIKSDHQLDTHDLKVNEFQTLQNFQTKEILEAQKLKQRIQAQEKEAERLDAELETEELKVENLKEEQQRLQFFRDLVTDKNQFHSILSPLVQRHNIMNILKEPNNFKSPELEKGFVPIEYAPKDNQEKYAKEIEQILLKSQIDKQNALAQAAAIANQPPVVVKEEIIKHVKIPIPAPYIIRVPEPFEVKVPQPYPVPLEIIRHVPYPVVKVEQVEVEKPVPFEVEKRVPFPVEKKVFIKVDKPYIVNRIVPVEVKVPVRLPVRNKKQKLTIIKHIWQHS